jgi:hypothetical protein
MTTEVCKLLNCRSRRKETLTFSILFAAVVLTISCANNQPPKTITSEKSAQTLADKKAHLDQTLKVVYGAPGSYAIRVYIYGPETKNPGIYYFKQGTTLGFALSVSQPSAFARRAFHSNLVGEDKAERISHFHNLSEHDKEEILHDNDSLFFPTQDW